MPKTTTISDEELTAAQRERLRVKRSPIHGKGVFAARKIRRGTLLGVYSGRRTRRNGMHVLWVEDEDGDVYGIDGTNSLRFLNHSSDPNAEFQGDELYAIRTIPAGAEITFHYGEDWEGV